VKKGAYVIAENNAGATPLHYLVVNNASDESALFLEVLVSSPLRDLGLYT
jgi:ankyrin repeat protein